MAADARYADDISDAAALTRSTTQRRAAGNAADVIQSDANRRSINIYSSPDAPVVAVNDGVIKKMGETKELGKFIVLQDAYGNRYTYSQLGSISQMHPVPRQSKLGADAFKLEGPQQDASPKAPATAGDNSGGDKSGSAAAPASNPFRSAPAPTQTARQRLFAFPDRPGNADQASLSGQSAQPTSGETQTAQDNQTFHFDPKTMQLKPLKIGSRVVGGSEIGRIGKSQAGPPRLNFAIQPAGRGAPTIDPKPILDGWKLLETTAIYRANDKNPFGSDPTVGQVLLESKAALMQRVLADPKLSIYSCGRNDIQTGQIDRRVLAVMEYLVAKGYRLTITSLKCGHGYLTSSGNVSAHSYGSAVDIAAVNGIPITGHQGPGHDHRGGDQGSAPAPGRHAPRADHLLDGPRAPHLHPARPLQPHSRRLYVLDEREPEPARGDAQARAVAAADPAPRGDPEPEGAGEALGRRGPHRKGQAADRRLARGRLCEALQEPAGDRPVDALLGLRVDPNADPRERAGTSQPRIEVVDLHPHADPALAIRALRPRRLERQPEESTIPPVSRDQDPALDPPGDGAVTSPRRRTPASGSAVGRTGERPGRHTDPRRRR